MRFWLLKTEPETYSFEDLIEHGSCWWDGVRNYQARNNLRSMQGGDLVIVYHSNATPSGAVGVARIVGIARADESQFDEKSPYYDPKSTRVRPRWVEVRLEPVFKYRRLVPLSELRDAPNMQKSELVRKGSRLSVIELSLLEYETVCGLGEQLSQGGPFHPKSA
jgi:predicted RNA-binding protein with PUA-like domain